MRRVLSVIALGTALAAGPVLPSSAHADTYPALYIGGLKLGYNVPTCVQLMSAAMAKSAIGLDPPSAIGVGGKTLTTRVYAVCVARPRDGYCGAEGATAVISAAGSDSKTLLQTVISNVQYPKLGCL